LAKQFVKHSLEGKLLSVDVGNEFAVFQKGGKCLTVKISALKQRFVQFSEHSAAHTY
jgi:NifU-like protein involved in Fe-S cluster formation